MRMWPIQRQEVPGKVLRTHETPVLPPEWPGPRPQEVLQGDLGAGRPPVYHDKSGMTRP